MRVRRKQIERITITGSMKEVEKAYNYCSKHGFRLTYSGPKRLDALRVDVTRFKIVAEREKQNDPPYHGN